jgi:hypothetical protein
METQTDLDFSCGVDPWAANLPGDSYRSHVSWSIITKSGPFPFRGTHRIMRLGTSVFISEDVTEIPAIVF